MKRLKALWDRALAWERWYQPTFFGVRLVIELGIQNFGISLQVSDADKPPCFTRVIHFGASPYVLCVTIKEIWRNRHLRNMEYKYGDEVAFGNGTEATVANNYGDGTILVITRIGERRESHRVPEDQISMRRQA